MEVTEFSLVISNRRFWEVIFLCLDSIGIVIFFQLFLNLLPDKWWRAWWSDKNKGKSILFACAIVKLFILISFAWLFIADFAVVSNFKIISWTSEFPTRGMFLRMSLLIPGAYLLMKWMK